MTSFVHPQCPHCLSGERFGESIHHGDKEDTEDAQREPPPHKSPRTFHKRIFLSCWSAIVALLFALDPVTSGQSQVAPASDTDKLLYADFNRMENGRLVSARGGQTRLNRYAHNTGLVPRVRGLENVDPPAPAAARVTDSDTAAAFDYEIRIPNEWAGVNLEVFGLPEKDGKLVPDDVSSYAFITFRLFAKGPQSIRVELITRGQGANLESGYPFATFRLSQGFNTYKLKLNSFKQPEWASRLDFKHEVLKKLTSVTIGVSCENCRLETGTVVVDNIAFEK